MYEDLIHRFDLKSLAVDDVKVSTPGRHAQPSSLEGAWCPGECGGGPLETVDALERQIERMVGRRETEATLVVKCPRYKPSSTEWKQTCLGGLTAQIHLEYKDSTA